MPLHKKVCNLCKNNICYDCAEKRTIFGIFDRFYCPKCTDQGIEIDKNKIRLKFILGLVVGGAFALLAILTLPFLD